MLVGFTFESGELGAAEGIFSFVQTFFADGAGAGEDDWPGLCAGGAESLCANVAVAANATAAITKATIAKK